MKTGPLNLDELDRNYLCIVELATQPQGVLLQATLRPDKIHDGLIRLGETQDDEARCWIRPEHVVIVSILGVAVENEGKWSCRPMLEVVKSENASFFGTDDEREILAMVCPGM